jgi:hypothetical protein
MTSLAKRALVVVGVLAVAVGALSPAAMGRGPGGGGLSPTPEASRLLPGHPR